jgi:hypothetical protein
MFPVDTEINKALKEFSESVPETNVDWILIRKIGPLDVFVRWFEQGKVEVAEKINNVMYTCYIKAIPVT